MSYLIFVLAVLSRFFPHPLNFSPVFGALLFGGAHLKRRDSIWFPVALLAVSDVLLTLFAHQMQMNWTHLFVWSGFAVVAKMGQALRRGPSWQKLLGFSLAGPATFYLISNFGVWLGSPQYPLTPTGLLACYVVALPYLRNSLLSSMLFSAILFGSYELYQGKYADEKLHKKFLRAR